MHTAIVTPSYSGDFERCRLLCESVDRRVAGFSTHYIVVEKKDVDRFAPLAGPRRRIVDERAILPSWLVAVPDPASFGRRRLWLSAKGPPLRGWHVQQLRKIAMAATLSDDGILFCDSDTVFIRRTDLADLWSGSRFTFYRDPGGIRPDMAEHLGWSGRAGDLLGLRGRPVSRVDYVAQVVGWRTDTVREMLARIEAEAGRSWAAAIAADRRFSEYLIYGRFVDELEGRPDRHEPTGTAICHSCWSADTLARQDLASFFGQASARQPAVGIQSFLGTDLGLIREAAGLA
jgi:hypothetical protein